MGDEGSRGGRYAAPQLPLGSTRIHCGKCRMQLSFSEISGLFSVATGIYGLFILASPRLRDEYRVGLVRWLRGEQELGQNWGTTFLTVFDSAFRVVRRRIPLVGAVYLPGMLVSAL